MGNKYATYNSDFLSYTIDNEKGRIAFFGVESGGRDRDKHASYNLMLPGYGAQVGAFKKGGIVTAEADEKEAFYENAKGQSAKFVFENDRTMRVDMKNPIKSDIFSTRFSVKTAPPTIWTKKSPKHLKSKNPLTFYKTQFALPMTVHFPDFGRVEISSTSPDVFCVEELQASKDFMGLDLGYLNHSYNHNRIHGLHYGSSFLTFKSNKPLDSVTITFKVMEECYPALPEDDERFNGLKRNWLNSFAMNRELFDMGDNIYFHGTGHLAIHMKSDMLQMANKGDEQFKIIRRVYEKQIERSFKRCQAYDGEVSVSFFKKEKPKGKYGCSVDSTPGAIIGLTGISHWNLAFAKRMLPYAIKAADFLMTQDTDGDGIFEVPFPGDYMGQQCESGGRSNWWDNFSFGHKDIYFNCLCHRALRELSELLVRVGRAEEAEKYQKQLELFDKNFFEIFYNPETELMAGWISKNGKVHDYGFTFAVSMGINEGVIPKAEGKKMLKKLLSIMKKEGYGDLRFGIPGNVMPVAQEDTIYWPCMSDWGRYENGGLNGMNGYHFLTAMYKVGLRREADEILFAIMDTYEKEMTHTGLMPGYCQSVDWRTKEGVRCGYNYLADNYYFLLSAYVGKYKMKHPSVAI